MIEPSKAYSRRQLISVAEVASTLAASRNIAGLEAVQQLAEAVRVGMLCPDLYPPHQQWQHGGDAKRIGKPSSNSSGVWHSLAAASAKRHMSDKDDFNYPPAASTWHVLADDVMKFSGHHSIPSRVCAALQELAARYKPELAAPPLKAEASRNLAGDQDDAPAEHQAAQQDSPLCNTHPPKQSAQDRQASRWQMCIDAGLSMPQDTYAFLPPGIKEIARILKITRQALAEDLNKHRESIFGR